MRNKNSILIILLLLLFSISGWCGKIIYPWNATTAIVKAGNNFEIWYEADDNEAIESIALKGPYNSVNLALFSIEKGFWVYDEMSGNTYNRKVLVELPQGIPEERYDLVLTTSLGKTISRSAVKVIRAYKTEYSIFHISDTHLCDDSTREPGAAPFRLNYLSALVNIANILGSEIVFLTGDNVNSRSGGEGNKKYLETWPSTQERIDFLYQGSHANGLLGVKDFNGAAFTVNGNHDQYERPADGKETKNRFAFWNIYHGIRTHHFSYGTTRFMALSNAFGEDLDVQAARHSAWLKEVESGKLRIVYQHIYNQVPEKWFAKDSIHLGLCGHNHHIGPKSPYPNGTTDMYIVNFTEYTTFNVFRVNASGEYEVINNATAIENPGDDPSEWIPKLTLSYEKSNNGTFDSNSAIVDNKFDFAIPDAHIRFLMPKGYYYTTSQGTVDQQFDGDSLCVVDVRLPVGASSKVTVSIRSTDNPIAYMFMEKAEFDIEN